MGSQVRPKLPRPPGQRSMVVAINRRPQESLNRLLRRVACYHSPGEQAASGPGTPSRSAPERRHRPPAGGGLEPSLPDPHQIPPGPSPRVGYKHLSATGSGQLFELTSRQTAGGDQAWSSQRLVHRGAGGLADQHFPGECCQGQVALGGPLPEGLESIVRHVPYLQGRSHRASITACGMRALGFNPRARAASILEAAARASFSRACLRRLP